MKVKELRDLIITIKELRIAGRYKESADISEKAIQIARELKDYQSELKAMHNKVISLFYIGDITHATTDLLQYMKLCQEHGDTSDFMKYYNVAGEIHILINQLDRAQEYLTKSLELSLKLSDMHNLSRVYSNLARIYFLEGDFEQALHYGLLSLQTVETCDDQWKKENFNFWITLQAHLADAYASSKQFERAKEVLDSVLSDPLLQKFQREKGIVFRSKAVWHEAQQQYEQAYDAYMQAKKAFSSYGDVYLLKRINRQLIQLLTKMDKKVERCKVQQEYIEIFELLEQQNHSRISAQLNVDEQHETYKIRAYQDPLTNIHNRAYIEERAEKYLEEAVKNKQSVGCILFDIDHFKYFNDEHGHLFGDEVIKLMANYADEYFKQYDDMFGRFGGDEFVGLVKFENLEMLHRIVQQLHESLCTLTIEKDERAIPIYVSMGISHNAQSHTTNYEALFHLADNALYQSKNNGRRRFTIIDS